MLGVLGYPLKAIALPHKELAVNNFFNSQREARGVKVVPVNKAVSECLRALRKNELVAILGDRDFGPLVQTMKFFGKDVVIPKGAATFSVKTGSGIIPSFLTRSSDGKFILKFGNPIYPPENTRDTDVKTVVDKITYSYLPFIESAIKENPSQWMMFRKFWVDEKFTQN